MSTNIVATRKRSEIMKKKKLTFLLVLLCMAMYNASFNPLIP